MNRVKYQPVKYPQDKLVELYAAGGIDAVVAHYGMSRNSARNLLTNRGIHKPREYERQESNAFLDKAILAAYSSGDFQNVRLVAERHKVKLGWVKSRAFELGCRPQALRKEPRWSERETEMLIEYQGYSPTTIQRKLKAAGFIRTTGGIIQRIHTLKLNTTRFEGYSAADVVRFLGIKDVHVVTKWIEKGWLIAEKRKYMASSNISDPSCWFIMPGDLQDFLRENVSLIDLRKVANNKMWFVSILTDNDLPRMRKKPKVSSQKTD